jgi:hypothetical protein
VTATARGGGDGRAIPAGRTGWGRETVAGRGQGRMLHRAVGCPAGELVPQGNWMAAADNPVSARPRPQAGRPGADMPVVVGASGISVAAGSACAAAPGPGVSVGGVAWSVPAWFCLWKSLAAVGSSVGSEAIRAPASFPLRRSPLRLIVGRLPTDGSGWPLPPGQGSVRSVRSGHDNSLFAAARPAGFAAHAGHLRRIAGRKGRDHRARPIGRRGCG